jgi:cell division protein ZapA
MAKNRTDIRVGGRDYTMVSEEPSEYILRVAAYVDRKMQELNAAAKLSNAMASVLAALNIADELFHAQDENARMRKDLAEARQQLAITARDYQELLKKTGASSKKDPAGA